MKINIFKIDKDKEIEMFKKFTNVNLFKKGSFVSGEWLCDFYLSENPTIKNISWIQNYKSKVEGLDNLENNIYFGVLICKRGLETFAISYGKAHFYLKNFSEESFGLDMAKRIANKEEVKMEAVKRFSGKESRKIKSLFKASELDIDSGESVDYIQANIIQNKINIYGKKSKFGNSIIVTREDLDLDNISHVLDDIFITLNMKSLFELPKIEEIKDITKISEYNQILIKEIKKENFETTEDSYSIIGVDFSFSNNKKYVYSHNGKISSEFEDINIFDIKDFIKVNNITDKDILNIKIKIKEDNENEYNKSLFQVIEFVIPEQSVILENGKWKKFNEEYICQLDESIDSISCEDVEDCFKIIDSSREEDFNDVNKNDKLSQFSYQTADKNFDILKINGNYKIEAWDLIKKDGKDIVSYAVKFGKASNLSYACDQAYNVLEIIRNNANLKKLSDKPNIYCLWFAVDRKNMISKVSEFNSIILKQKIDIFAKKCREVGLIPRIKLSHYKK